MVSTFENAMLAAGQTKLVGDKIQIERDNCMCAQEAGAVGTLELN